MTWLLKIKRRAQNAMVRWLDFSVEPKHRRPSGDLLNLHVTRTGSRRCRKCNRDNQRRRASLQKVG